MSVRVIRSASTCTVELPMLFLERSAFIILCKCFCICLKKYLQPLFWVLAGFHLWCKRPPCVKLHEHKCLPGTKLLSAWRVQVSTPAYSDSGKCSCLSAHSVVSFYTVHIFTALISACRTSYSVLGSTLNNAGVGINIVIVNGGLISAVLSAGDSYLDVWGMF